jgi:NADH-quinone oxidoreductase subunit E
VRSCGRRSRPDYLKEKLGIGFGETTPDGTLHAEGRRVHRRLRRRPVLLVNNNHMCSFMGTETKLDALLDELKKA